MWLIVLLRYSTTLWRSANGFISKHPVPRKSLTEIWISVVYNDFNCIDFYFGAKCITFILHSYHSVYFLKELAPSNNIKFKYILTNLLQVNSISSFNLDPLFIFMTVTFTFTFTKYKNYIADLWAMETISCLEGKYIILASAIALS